MTLKMLARRGALSVSMMLLTWLMSGCADMRPAMPPMSMPTIDDFWGEPVSSQPAEPENPTVSVVIADRDFQLNGKDSVVGQLATVNLHEGDTLLDIARHYGLGYQHIVEANPGVDIWVPQEGVRPLLPLQFILPDAKRQGVVINVAAMRLFYFKGGKNPSLSSFPIGIGREGRSTPLGEMAINRKQQNPTWYVPESIRRTHAERGDPLPSVVPPGPDNPLGQFALYLTRPSYLIHGTDKPFSIGLRASNGCIRLYPEDIEQAFKEIPVKTPVTIVNQPYLLGWLNGELYLQAHEPFEEVDDEMARKRLTEQLQQISKQANRAVDMAKVDRILRQRRGIPTPVFVGTPSLKDIIAQAPQLQRPEQLTGQPQPVEPGRLEAEKNAWFIRTAATDDGYRAQKLAAQMNRLGPRIPAYVVLKGQQYQVIGGPFKQEQAARKAQNALNEDFNAMSEIIKPSSKPETLAQANTAATGGKPAVTPSPAAAVKPVKPEAASPDKPAAKPTRPEASSPDKTLTAKPAKAEAVKPEKAKSPGVAEPAKTIKPEKPVGKTPPSITLKLPKPAKL